MKFVEALILLYTPDPSLSLDSQGIFLYGSILETRSFFFLLVSQLLIQPVLQILIYLFFVGGILF